MKRLAAALAITLILLTAGVVWLMMSTTGIHWVMEHASRQGVFEITAGKVAGRLYDHLVLTDIHLTLAHTEITIDRAELEWQPVKLLSGAAIFNNIKLQGLKIQSNSNQPLSLLPWPKVSGIAAQLHGKIDHLEITDISYRHLQQPAVPVHSIGAVLAWQDGQLSVSDFSAVAEYGQLIGTASAGFSAPALQLDLIALPLQAIAQMDRFIIQTQLLPQQEHGPLKSTIQFAGQSGDTPVVQLSGEMEWLANGFNLSHLQLTRNNGSGKITGEGKIIVDGPQPVVTLQMQASNLDLATELGWPAMFAGDLSATLTLVGTPEKYQGHVAVANAMQERQSMVLAGDFVGNQQGLKIAALTGSWLDGRIRGNLDLSWAQGIMLRAALQGRQLSPARLAPAWKGVINADVSGSVAWSSQQPLRAEIQGKLLDSRLHGQALTGEMAARYAEHDLEINNLLLRGKGFDLHASGKLQQRVVMSAHISNLASLMPGTTGALDAKGWVRWRKGQLSGMTTVHGQQVVLNNLHMEEGNVEMQAVAGKTARLHIAATLHKVGMGQRFQAEAVIINGDGNLREHAYKAVLLSDQAEASLAGSGSYQQQKWQGQITEFSGHDSIGPWHLAQPATLSISPDHVALAPFILTGPAPEQLELSAELTRSAAGIAAAGMRAKWNELNLARASGWLQGIQFAGSSSGAISLNVADGQVRAVEGNATMAGTVLRPGQSISFQRSTFNLHGGTHGLRAEINVHLEDGGTIKGKLSSALPLHAQWPKAGEYALEWTAMDLAVVQPWLANADRSSDGARLEGKFSGHAVGKIFPGQRFDMQGSAEISESIFHWRSAGEINVNVRSAVVSWQWQEKILRADWTLALAQLGQLRGNLQLPIAAHLPVAPEATGAVQASITGQVQENGTITALFPGWVQESQGQLDADIHIAGTWQAPLLQGTLQLSKAAAYLPATGIHISDIQLNVSLQKDIVRIDSFQATSGPGHIAGAGVLYLQGTRMIRYQGTLKGEDFQTVYFPELQVLSSPHLTFEGSPDKLVVRGEVQLPQLRIIGPQPNTVIQPNEDVIMTGAAEPASRSSLALDAQIHVVLGDEVMVQAKGVDARLSGSVDITMAGLDKISSKGEIQIVKGSYQTYGVNLDIVRGKLFYSEGPVAEPALDILALRTIGDVRAGVMVSGTLKTPITKLYSEPAMPDVDILAYIVLGHPLDNSREQESLITLAANALLSSGQSAALQDQIKRRLGLGDVEIQVVGGGSDGHMGYKAVPLSPPGMASNKQEEGLSQAMITVGKYVTPKIYISYGRSLFTGSKLFFLRYDISRRWQVETQTGNESGVDVYYKIEFN